MYIYIYIYVCVYVYIYIYMVQRQNLGCIIENGLPLHLASTWTDAMSIRFQAASLHVCMNVCHFKVTIAIYDIHVSYLHEKLLWIQRVSNPSTGNQRMSTPAVSSVVKIENVLSFGGSDINQTKGWIPHIHEVSWAVYHAWM